ncbi:MAG: hypothetical protein JWN04_4845 [Myxococcaceae bacterium]|nr:hypothetical protein [Myxococcaceae bacterium]
MNKLISIDDAALEQVSGGNAADVGSAIGGAIGGAVDKTVADLTAVVNEVFSWLPTVTVKFGRHSITV